jgi:NAD(P)H-dependent flavin oxidoreductase YrpB (nitropropane dioxygenase family)
VEVVVAQGVEAGGHVRGEIATMPLVPAVVDAVGPVPVVAAGGIADGRGLAAALALGASGAWIGTRFLASDEAFAHPDYKRAVVDASPSDAVLTTIFDAEWPDAPHRVLRSDDLASWMQADQGGRSAMLPTPDMAGDVSGLAHYAGQSAGLVHDVLPAGEIVRRIAREAEDLFRALAPEPFPRSTR